MRVRRSQAEENHRNVIDAAGRLFREYGFDGIGVSNLMKGAGLTQGGFYKQFASKEDLMAKAMAAALARSRSHLEALIAEAGENALETLVRYYLSPQHRDATGKGCCFPALGAEAQRHGPEVRMAFEEGVKSHLKLLKRTLASSSDREAREKAMSVLSTMVGAMVLSRAVGDAALSSQILGAATRSILGDEANCPPKRPKRS